MESNRRETTWIVNQPEVSYTTHCAGSGLVAQQRDRAGAPGRLVDQPEKRGTRYSITSSARASSVGGMVSFSILAVSAFMTSSNLLVCRTGRSVGFAPLRI